MSNPARILVIRHRFLGDTILSVPFLRALRRLYPEAQIAVLVSEFSGQLLQNNPYIDELICFDNTDFHRYEKASQPKNFWQAVLDLRARRFDRVYILKRSFSSALMSFLAGIPERIGFDTEARGFLLTERISFNSKRHEALNFLAHLELSPSLGELSDIAFWPTKTESEKACAQLANLTGRKIILHAPSAHPLKLWSVEHWAKLALALGERGFQLIFSGAPSDLEYYAQIEALMTPQKPALNLCSLDNTLRENVALYAQCELMIAVDSGPLHLAAATGIPVIALFGPTDPARWSPLAKKQKILTLDLTCRPCNLKPTCQNRECLTELSPELVLQEALGLLG